ncbi:MAG: FtsW/RodA/SpoVE family cell cycle protein, partial [Actinomycetota bacterium]
MILAAARRNAEISLLVLSLIIATGGYWLASLARSATLPPGVLIYGVTLAGIYLAGHLAIRKLAPAADPLFFPIAMLLNGLGFVLIYRLESTLESPGLAAAQVRWLGIGVAAFIATLWLVKHFSALGRYRYTFAAAGVFLLLLPMLPGIGKEVNGARLWIQLPGLRFQPAELGKIALVLFFAGYLTERREVLAVAHKKIGPIGIPAARHFGPVLAAWAISLLVMINEKDLGSSLLFFAIFVVILWVATGRPAYLLVGLVLFVAGAFVASQLFGHVATRIEVWRDPFAQLDGKGYQ